MEIHLRYVNLAATSRPFDVVVFQKNRAASDRQPICWRLIRRCPRGWHHRFSYATDLEVNVADGRGTRTPNRRLIAGTRTVFADGRLDDGGRARSLRQFEIGNEATRGSIDVWLHRAGYPVARKCAVVPKQTAFFDLDDELYLAAVDAPVIREGQPFDPTRLTSPITRLRLFGITEAEIVAHGGGPGPRSEALRFALASVVTTH